MGTLILSGNGIGIVVETGKNTEVGKIAKQLGAIKEHSTPLQLNIKKIVRFIVYLVSIFVVIIFVY